MYVIADESKEKIFLINLTGKIVVISFYLKLYLHNILKLFKIIILNTVFHHLNVFFVYTSYIYSISRTYVFEKFVI